MPLSGRGEGFSWDLNPAEGFFMKNEVSEGNWEDVFAIYRGGNGLYQAHFNGEIYATKGVFGALAYDGNPSGEIKFAEDNSAYTGYCSIGQNGFQAKTTYEASQTARSYTMQLNGKGLVGVDFDNNKRYCGMRMLPNGFLLDQPAPAPNGGQSVLGDRTYAEAMYGGSSILAMYCPTYSSISKNELLLVTPPNITDEFSYTSTYFAIQPEYEYFTKTNEKGEEVTLYGVKDVKLLLASSIMSTLEDKFFTTPEVLSISFIELYKVIKKIKES